LQMQSQEKIKLDRKVQVLLGVTGSVATIKLKPLVEAFLEFAEVKVVCTTASQHFYKKEDVPSSVQIHTDFDEYNTWKQIGDKVLHVELRKWADVYLIAPLSANTLAKLANGLSDNLLTCVARAWDTKKPFLVAPAMNTFMWEHKLTSKHLKDIADLNISTIPPVEKLLACGDKGFGGLAAVDDIVSVVRNLFEYKPCVSYFADTLLVYSVLP